MGEDIIGMSQKELKRVGIIQQLAEKKLKQIRAAEALKLSCRQIRRIVARYAEEGNQGLVHRSRGRASNRRHPEELRQRVLKIFEKEYRDFGPTLAQEKLAERQKIVVGRETLREWLIGAHLWEKRRKVREHREWRERRANYGEMQQYDGSHHDWLEGRGPKLVLNAYIDDATNRVFGRFDKYEGTLPALDVFHRYAKRYGLPRIVYLDKHGAYKAKRQATIEEQLAGKEPQSQFERALEELGVEVIHAESAPAKGRIERLFKTFQDRLIKEMRLAGVKTLEEANDFLEKYLPIHNQRFGYVAREVGDVHRPVVRGIDLKKVLSIQTRRSLRKDNVVRHENRLYLILEKWSTRRPTKVTIQERLNGKLYIVHENRDLKYREVHEAPKLLGRKPVRKGIKAQPVPMDHPLKAASYRRMLERKTSLAA